MNSFIAWVTEYWFVVVALVAVLGVAGTVLYRFVGLPTEEQLKKVREWLLYAVSIAEKELGSGTGKLKLRYVYDWFLRVFPWLAKVITFEMFSKLVDDALEEMERMLNENKAAKELVLQIEK